MNRKERQALAQQAAKGIKTEKDLCDFSAMLKKITVEAALNAGLDDHPGYERHQPSDDVDVPRDRDASVEPQIVRQHQTRLTAVDDRLHCLYAKGMTTREMVATFKEMYDADVPPSLISKVTNAVIGQVIEWQLRPLDAVY